MKKIKYSIILSLVAVFMIGVICIVFFTTSIKDQISIVKTESYFSDFEVKGNKVYIKCYITLKNTYNTEKTIRIVAKSPEDVTTGLLKNADLISLNESGEVMEYKLPSKSKKSYYVTFVGDFAGKNKKHDRNLPQIEIINNENK